MRPFKAVSPSRMASRLFVAWLRRLPAWAAGHARVAAAIGVALLGVGALAAGSACGTGHAEGRLAAGDGGEPTLVVEQEPEGDAGIDDEGDGGAARHEGLFARGEDAGAEEPRGLPIVAESLAVTLTDGYARTELSRTYLNDSSARLEGTFALQAGDEANVTRFAYYRGAQKVVGEIFEKEKAEKIYADTTGLGRDPGLGEKAGEGAFTFRVFPIEPNEKKRIDLTVERQLGRHGERVEYRFPLESRAKEALAVAVDLADRRGVRRVTSPTHALSVSSRGPTALHVVAHARGPARELVLRYELEDAPFTPAVVVHRTKGQDAYARVTLPAPLRAETGAPRTPKDVTVVLDRSGSMSGEPLANALKAAKELVNRLHAEDRLNVVAFDDQVDALFAKPEPASPATRDKARAFIDALDSRGGTDIAAALKRALDAQHGADGRPHVVAFFTDGQSDTKAALAVAAESKNDTRVFTVGLGSGVDRSLLGRLASMKRGRFTFIERASAIETKSAELWARLETPVLVDVKVSVEGLAAKDVYPRTLPDLFEGDELRVAMRLAGVGAGKVVVEGTRGGKPVRFERAFEAPAEVKAPAAGRAWATSRVQDLLEGIALEGETEPAKNEVVELAIAYDMVTPYTAFLAIPESELTDASKDDLAAARKARQQILAAHPDAVALSRDAMPPGDPLLEVRAPRNARQVTAVFPFGLVEDLAWDEARERWATRFLVPKDVADGVYDVKVVVVEADGTVREGLVRYTIDAEDPEALVEVRPTGEAGRVEVTVRASEALREVRVFVGGGGPEIALGATDDATTYRGTVSCPSGGALRVVVTDAARNERALDVALDARGRGRAGATSLADGARGSR